MSKSVFVFTLFFASHSLFAHLSASSQSDTHPSKGRSHQQRNKKKHSRHHEHGSRSLNGATGATGTKGDMGATGATGASVTGATGASSATGATGLAGSTGPTGEAGPTGNVGSTGTTGSTGAAGSAGVQGSTGPTGSVGATGSGSSLTSYYSAYSTAGNAQTLVASVPQFIDLSSDDVVGAGITRVNNSTFSLSAGTYLATWNVLCFNESTTTGDTINVVISLNGPTVTNNNTITQIDPLETVTISGQRLFLLTSTTDINLQAINNSALADALIYNGTISFVKIN